MAEPVGVTGTAVGIVSLCLQIYSSLNEYLTDFRDRDAYVNKALEHLSRLRDLVGVIEPAVLAIQNEHDTPSQTVLQCLRSCEVEILLLNTEIQKHSLAATTSPWQKLREMKKKLEFPFARSDLEKLAGRLDRINNSLSLALHGLGLHIQGTNRDKLVDIVNSARTTAGDLATIRDDIDDINSRGANLEASVEFSRIATTNIVRDMQRLSLVDTKIQASFQQIGQIYAATSSSNDLLQDIATHQRNTARLEERMNELKDLITQTGRDSPAQILFQMLLSRPGLLKSWQDDLETIHPKVSRLPNESEQESSPVLWPKRPKPRTGICGCRPRRQTTRTYSRWLFLMRFNESIIHIDHEPWCRLYSPDHQHSFGAIFTGLRGLLNVALLASFTSRRGAGGCSFSPKFQCYAMVDREKSPAFRIAHEICKGINTLSDEVCLDYESAEVQTFGEMMVQAGVSKLRRIYSNRLSLPTDTDEYGHTVLEYFLDGLRARPRIGDRPLLGYTTSLELLELGVPFVVNSPRPLDNKQRSDVIARVLSRVSLLGTNQIRSGARPDIVPLLIKSHPENFSYAVNRETLWYYFCDPSFRERLFQMEGVAELFGLDHPLFVALMKKDENLLGHILSEPSLSPDSCVRGKVPAAYVAIFWPRGLEMLLNHRPDIDFGAKLTDEEDRSAFNLAVLASNRSCQMERHSSWHDCPWADSIEILLKSPCHPSNATYCLNNSKQCRSLITQWTNDECIPCDRHNKRHYETITAYLTFGAGGGCLKVAETFLRHIRLWQEQWIYILEDHGAHNEIRALKAKGIIPFCDFQLHQDGNHVSLPPYHPGAGSIYHLIESVDVANVAFNLGFTDFDTYRNGIAPVMQHYAHLEYPEWLLDHGASPMCLMDFTSHFKQSPSDILPRLTAAHLIMRYTAHYHDLSISDRSSDLEIPLLRRLGNMQVGDDCTCRCSNHGGCTPLAVFIKELCRCRRDKSVMKAITRRIGSLICENVATSLSATANQVIRVLTFEALEVRHTCCQTVDTWHDEGRWTKRHPLEGWRSYGEDFADIRDEDELLLNEVDELVSEFEDKFHSSGYSLADFLGGYWRERIEEVIREKNTRRLTEAEKEAAAELGIRLREDETRDKRDRTPGNERRRTPEDVTRECIREMDRIYM
ncbi:hypothetical protein F5Y04DRAFT_202201 [Hypomontagnella monticulosa]|nr:hypothetical protein F5Y04DRAFT_202201 [Hypomontagnella monticulosa]